MWLTHAEQYRWLQVDYQIGVFVSRSSVNLVAINKIWIMAVLQVTSRRIASFPATVPTRIERARFNWIAILSVRQRDRVALRDPVLLHAEHLAGVRVRPVGRTSRWRGVRQHVLSDVHGGKPPAGFSSNETTEFRAILKKRFGLFDRFRERIGKFPWELPRWPIRLESRWQAGCRCRYTTRSAKCHVRVDWAARGGRWKTASNENRGTFVVEFSSMGLVAAITSTHRPRTP